MGFIVEGIKGINSLFFPSRCPYCGLEGVRYCNTCLDEWHSKFSIRYLSKIPVISMHPYDVRATSIVLAAKERGERDARLFISTAIQSALQYLASRDHHRRRLMTLTIPASRRSMRRRGEDFLIETMKEVDFTSLPLLKWSREVRDQSSLTLHQREINLHDALLVDEAEVARQGLPVPGVGLVIIDDVLTTGATMEAAISAISHSSLGTSSLVAGVTACYSVNPLFA